MSFSYISLFSGLGGFEQALNNQGGKCLLSSEINVQANKAYQILYGEPTAGDIKDIPDFSIPKCDILVAGFPCQSFSAAGNRGGLTDARGTLFYEVLRVVTHAEPKAFILENVLGLLTHDGGRTIQTILRLLSFLPYRFDFKLLNSSDFNLPQHRERFILVGIHKNLSIQEDWPLPTKNPLLIERTKKIFQASTDSHDYMFNFAFPQSLPLEKTLSDMLMPLEEISSDYFFSEERTQRILDKLAAFDDEPTTALYKRRPQVLRKVRTPYAKKIRKEYEAGTLPIKRSTLYFHLPRCNDKSNTLTTVITDNLVIGYSNNKTYIRYLHPKECLALQGFPSTVYTKLAPHIPKTHLYRMSGNAVSVPLIESVLKSVLPYLQIKEENNVSRETTILEHPN